MRTRSIAALALAAAAVALVGSAASQAKSPNKLNSIKHIVVIYEENHSFDNLYGGWEGVNGLAKAPVSELTQVSQNGTPFTCLKQLDVNLVAAGSSCSDSTTASPFTSAFKNGAVFSIDSVIPSTARTCPSPTVFGPANGIPDGQGLPGGCTRDLVHRYYQEQYQLDNGKMDRYVTGSDSAGTTMGMYDTKALPVYQYLHAKGHPDYAISDAFFQGAFGGSFLNHQWLIAAQSPVWPGAVNDGSASDLHSVLDSNGMPANYPLYTSPLATTALKDQQLTQSCNPAASRGPVQPAFQCGDFAVNTTQPWYQPYWPGTVDAKRLPPLKNLTIGDELTAKRISWAWYGGGWSNANGDVGAPGWTNGSGPTCSDPNANTNAIYPNCPDGDFQYHHQAFNYYASFAPGTAQRTNDLRDEAEFIAKATASTKTCQLRQVSFIKPLGEENEHPGYASTSNGESHLVTLLKAVESSACAKDTMVIVTYDEFGGQFDHVPPPGQGSTTAGPHDAWGPGTRIPALTVAPGLSAPFAVDSKEHDTTSITATIEHRFGLDPLGNRDGQVNDMSSVFAARAAK